MDAFTDYLPGFGFAPDPAGIIAQAESVVMLVEPLQTPIQHSPDTSWSQGTPYPGPPAVDTKYIDHSSMRWWGRMGQGMLIWSGETEFSAEIQPAIPQDMAQHVDVFQNFMGGYPSIARNRPHAYGDQVPVLNPS